MTCAWQQRSGSRATTLAARGDGKILIEFSAQPTPFPISQVLRGFDTVGSYTGGMGRECLLSFLPPVLLSLALRAWLLASIVFDPDTDFAIAMVRAWLDALALFAGAPALILFAAVRLWSARWKLANLGVLLASGLFSAAILLTGLGEPYCRLQWKKPEYDAIAAQHLEAAVLVFDWGEGAGPALFSRFKEYLVIARGTRVQTFEAYLGHEIDSWGDERDEVTAILASAWDGKDRARRFRVGKFDACHMQVLHLRENYYYLRDSC